MKATTTPPLILITRPEPAGHRLAREIEQRLAEQGVRADILSSPLTQIEHLPLPETLPERPRAAIVTSQHALPALRAFVPQDIPVFAVGRSTALAARKAGFSVSEGPGAAKGLGQLIRESLPPDGGSLLYLHGEPLAHDLAADLAADGYAIAPLLVYRQRPLPFPEPHSAVIRRALGEGRRVILPILSPQGARNLADAWHVAGLPRSGQVKILAFSPRIGKIIERLGFPIAATLRKPDRQLLLTTLLELARKG